MQFLYWISQILRPDAPFLNTIALFDLPGAIDEACFDQAFQALVNQSDSMRTTVVEERGVPQRMVHNELPAQLEFVDLSDLDEADKGLAAWLQNRAARHFIIDEALYDAALVKLNQNHYKLFLNQHHLIADAVAFFLAFRVLAKAYERLVSGVDAALPASPQFETYVAYERQYRQSARYEKSANYWQKKLTPGPDPVRFYGAIPRKKGTGTTQIALDLGGARSEKMRKLAQQKHFFR